MRTGLAAGTASRKQWLSQWRSHDDRSCCCCTHKEHKITLISKNCDCKNETRNVSLEQMIYFYHCLDIQERFSFFKTSGEMCQINLQVRFQPSLQHSDRSACVMNQKLDSACHLSGYSHWEGRRREASEWYQSVCSQWSNTGRGFYWCDVKINLERHVA